MGTYEKSNKSKLYWLMLSKEITGVQSQRTHKYSTLRKIQYSWTRNMVAYTVKPQLLRLLPCTKWHHIVWPLAVVSEELTFISHKKGESKFIENISTFLTGHTISHHKKYTSFPCSSHLVLNRQQLKTVS